MTIPRCLKGRIVDGIILLDKPKGISSNSALQRVKRAYSAEKAGHTGTLDPLATGMLPICLGKATKFSQYLLDSEKCYTVTAKLGERTNTSDSEGEIIQTCLVKVSRDTLVTHIKPFLGEINQVPSMFSALKYQGRPLYEYARKGISVPRKRRKVTVFSINLLRFDNNKFEIGVRCSKGTYIRTIIDDIGQSLGCGAHVISLRRTAVAGYPQDKMITLGQIEAHVEHARETGYPARKLLDTLLLPIDTALVGLHEVNITSDLGKILRKGQFIQTPKASFSGQVRITEGERRLFLGVGEINSDGRVSPKRLVAR